MGRSCLLNVGNKVAFEQRRRKREKEEGQEKRTHTHTERARNTIRRRHTEVLRTGDLSTRAERVAQANTQPPHTQQQTTQECVCVFLCNHHHPHTHHARCASSPLSHPTSLHDSGPPPGFWGGGDTFVVGVWTESVAGWQRFDLWNQGTEQRANCELVPCTMRALRHLGDDLMRGCIFGFVYFSVLRGDGRTKEEEEEDDDDDETAAVEEAIPPHSGPTNVRLRCHMAIAVSQALSCELIVNGGTTATATAATTTTTTSWQEGKCFLLDDSFVHSVKITHCKSRVHRGEGDDGDDGGSPGAVHERTFRQSLLRAVLIVDVWHYQLSLLERETLRQVFA